MGASNYFLPTFFTLLGLIFIGISVLIPPVRSLVKYIVPQGSGPSESAMKNGRFTVKLVGEAEDGSKAIAIVRGVSDPGYRETAKMLSESVLCLALEKGNLDANDGTGKFGVLKGGVITAASGMGMRVVERLRNAGMTFEVEDI
jgi:short subunit dehydrogenase-like uncharacterized protein